MQVSFKDVPKVMLENEKAYFQLLEAAIESIDECSSLEIRKNPLDYNFRIAISSPDYLNPLVKVLNELHNLMGISLQYSKSIKSSYALSFKINLEN